ncbi:TRAP transporter substrate-binding protein [Alkalicoccus urumqiensis]|uniref:TRAP transporter substrate-binding protein n=2 Tax=Alkalicoccus urumqiensis TaxID=1548213 RepID=A0A2P6MF84_ALKUR|nr:TRAP transporter substrate-binding protein [Alkalicoccus urumqiensis]
MFLAACGGNDGGNNTTDVENNGGAEDTTENTENTEEEPADNEEPADEGNDGDTASDADVGNLQLGTGSTGGTYYPLGQEIATIVNNNIEVEGFDLSAVSSGASVDNIVGISQGEMDLGMSVHLPAQDALTGAGDFEGVEIDNFGFMGHIYPEVMQIVIPADSDIETVADLEGSSVAIGPPGSGTQAAARLILEAYGLEDGDYEAFEEGFGDAQGRIQDGQLDASFGLLGLPAGGIDELAASADIELLSLTEEGISYVEENSGYEQLTIPSDSYDFMEEDVEAITAYAVLLGSMDTIDEDLGYEITKAMFENAGDIAHPQGEQINEENALNGSDGLPMHPGAERYFEEAGISE